MLALPFYIPRSEMPQIEEEDYPVLFPWLSQRGIIAEKRCVPCGELHNHQRIAIDPVRAAAIPEAVLDKPIIAASDFFIVDGNHRWWVRKERGKLFVSAYMLSVPFGNALVNIAQFGRIHHEDGLNGE